jgi:DNA-binding NarL/FixJ family response regulator
MERLRNQLSAQELEAALRMGRTWAPEETPAKLLALLDEEEGLRVQIAAPAERGAEPALTDRELEVLRLMSQGMSTNEIAQTILFAFGTVKLDIQSIYRKLKVHNRAQAMTIAVERGLI